MNAAAALYALQLLQALPGLMAAGVNFKNTLATGTAKVKAMVDEQRNPSDDEWQWLNEQTAALRKDLHSDGPGG